MTVKNYEHGVFRAGSAPLHQAETSPPTCILQVVLASGIGKAAADSGGRECLHAAAQHAAGDAARPRPQVLRRLRVGKRPEAGVPGLQAVSAGEGSAGEGSRLWLVRRGAFRKAGRMQRR